MNSSNSQEKNKAGKNILFICAANVNRSVTAELWFSIRNPENHYESAGSNLVACRIHGGKYYDEAQLQRADRIICMDERNRKEILQGFVSFDAGKIEVAGIPDIYGFLEIPLIFAIIDNIQID
jgi:protein-tyrosine-phosphatase